VNAAFSRKIIAPANGSRRSNAQQWIETQNHARQRTLKNRSLQEALEDIIPEKLTVPLTCYPVVGAGSVTHYLIEATHGGCTSRAGRSQKVAKLEKAIKQNKLEQHDVDSTITDKDDGHQVAAQSCKRHFKAVG
jgi:hypothetical protein